MNHCNQHPKFKIGCPNCAVANYTQEETEQHEQTEQQLKGMGFFLTRDELNKIAREEPNRLREMLEKSFEFIDHLRTGGLE